MEKTMEEYEPGMRSQALDQLFLELKLALVEVLGTLGYFPTYTLGNLNAAKPFHRAEEEMPTLMQALGSGHYGTLLEWLRGTVHTQGCRFAPQQLMTVATGEPTQARHHVAHLRRTFLEK